MSSTDTNGREVVHVTLNAAQAQHVATRLGLWFEEVVANSLSDTGGRQSPLRNQLANGRHQFDKHAGWLEQIGWGEIDGDVTWTVPVAEAFEMASELALCGADQGRDVVMGGLTPECYADFDAALSIARTGLMIYDAAVRSVDEEWPS